MYSHYHIHTGIKITQTFYDLLSEEQKAKHRKIENEIDKQIMFPDELDAILPCIGNDKNFDNENQNN